MNTMEKWKKENRDYLHEHLRSEAKHFPGQSVASILADIAKTSEDQRLRWAAATELNDQKGLADVARNGKHDEARVIAAEKLVNDDLAQQAFIEIAKNTDNDYFVRESALINLKSRIVLADIAINDKNENLSIKTINRLSHLASILSFNEEKLIDEILAFIAKSKAHFKVREKAIEKLRNESILREIIGGSPEKYVFEERVFTGNYDTWEHDTYTVDLRKTASSRLKALQYRETHECKDHMQSGYCGICGRHEHAWVQNGGGSGSGLVISWCYYCHTYGAYYDDTGTDVSLVNTPDFSSLVITSHNCEDFKAADGVCALC